jgi:hypothetical protein
VAVGGWRRTPGVLDGEEVSQLAGALGGGGGASVSASSSASAGPSASGAGTTGSVLLDFGGINLGNQDIPLNAQTTSSSNAAPTLGTVASTATFAAAVDSYLPIILIIGAVIALAVWAKGKL